MKIAYISVIRNDHDVLPYNIQYYYNLGIRDFYFMLHKDDGSLEQLIITHPALGNDCHKYIFYNNTDDHYHEKDAQILIDAARIDGCDWIIGVDADEILILKQHKTIQEFLFPYNDHVSVVLKLKWKDYRPDREILNNENPFIVSRYACIDFMDTNGHPGWIKTCGKFDERMKYIPGFHDINNCSIAYSVSSDIAFYMHVPDRSFNQFVEKLTIQRKNWINRYGSFYLDPEILNNKEYLWKMWEERIIKYDGYRRLYCLSNKNDDKAIIYYYDDPINEKLFNM